MLTAKKFVEKLYMNSISSGLKDLFKATVHLLNQPVVKQGVKHVAGSVTLAFGIVEAYDLCKIASGRKISTDKCSDCPKWVRTATKVIVLLAKISLVLSACVSNPGVFVISMLVGAIFPVNQIGTLFGPFTTFVVNPLHPRHVFSIVAVIFALPSVAQSAYKGFRWTAHKMGIYKKSPHQKHKYKTDFTDSKVRKMNFFNTLTSRPLLHTGNRLGRFLFGSV